MDAPPPAVAPAPSAGQAAFLLAFLGCALLWAYAELVARRRPSPPTPLPSKLALPVSMPDPDGAPRPPPPPTPLWRCGLARCLRLEEDALLECRDVLRWCTELGAILSWFYLADRTSLLPRAGKLYSRDVFAFLCLAIAAAAAAGGTVAAKAPSLLNRHQTEEWKGWMQILFLLYHYFDAKELYNAIRVFIAAYVWMTGYGNFRYYAQTKDFSLGRVLQSLWRLNFLAAACCIVFRNSYMLYYICPMHTLFTLAVYAALAVAPSTNTSPRALALKFGACVAVVAAMWELPGVFDAFWGPLKPLVGYTDPRRPSPDALHEWRFRSGLDRYVWIHGMLCAALQPAVDAALSKVDASPRSLRVAARTAAGAAAAAALTLWARTVYTLPKIDYNRVHPYTSWVPITCWIVLRNIHPRLRQRSVSLLAWCGVITLETYIAQFHTWMATDIVDGQPKSLLAVVRGEAGGGAPLVGFALFSALALFLSRRLFLLTAALRDVVVPHAARATVTDARLLARNAGAVVGVGVGLWGAGAAAVAVAGR